MAASRVLARFALYNFSGLLRIQGLKGNRISYRNTVCLPWGSETVTKSSGLCSSILQHHFYSTDTTPHESEQSEEDDILYRRLLIEVKGHDVEVINSYEKFVKMAARELDLKVTSITTPDRIVERYTHLKSAHIYKKHRVQYETRTNFRTIELKHLTGSTADTFLEYIERNLPEGLAMKVSKHRIETIPSHLKPPVREEISA